ncbi:MULTISPECIES: glycosyltransferase [unclassified Clostridium]|uniref:glycosyltransferase family 4 protein n=1 Tax=unclassified Clostridium TaxID=2614128 RepID=UPI00207996B1|nr:MULTISPECIES: glycosyltransferase [unclassified Clostridium]
MKIAIVGPSSVPFTVGGMEYLLWGLQNQINNLSEHKVELIKLPTKEDNFWNLIDSYKQFYNLDLSHFDMIITAKYPAWMVKHKNHVCYMAHRLRGLYDTYHFMNLPDEPSLDNSYIKKAVDYMEREDSNIDGLFYILDEIKINQSKIPNNHFDLPSPFLRKIITFFDNKALENTKKFYAISKTVKNRKEYFPVNAEVEVVYPPSALPYFQEGEYEYLFTVSRLDNAKRIDLIIESMKYVKPNIKLKIAGTGPMEKELKKLASNDERIEFIGFVNDEELIKFYSNSKGVIFIPYEEDYGLVTIEAMMSKKPVITTYDAGGVTEFVQEGITGFISKSNASDIGKSIEKLANLKLNEVKEMGERAYNKVKDITWSNTVRKVTSSNINMKKRKKITVTSTFPIYPPKGGGQARIYNIYKNIAKEYEVEIVSFTSIDDTRFKGYISSGLLENRIPKSIKHQEEESKIEVKAGVPVTDIVMPILSKYTTEYSKEIKKSIEQSDLVIVSHPYLLYETKKHLNGKDFIYEAHNVEYAMKKEMLPDNKESRDTLKIVYDIEKECCEKSKLIMACSEEDKIKLSELYSVSQEKIVIVPNGVDTNETAFTTIDERLKNKNELGLRNEKIGLFMGSWHGPNLEACERIFEIANKCPDVKFMLMGSQCMYFQNKEIPENVGLLGLVSEEEKNRIFSVVDFALNPMISGSGTNLKMFDYMAAGIPIITSEFGTRGIENKDIFIIKDIDDMHIAINNFNLLNCSNFIIEAREYVKETFDWNVIVEKFESNLKFI